MFTEQMTQAITIANPTLPAAQTASFNGTNLDMTKVRRGLFLIAVGAVSGTTPTLDGKLQESVDGTTFTDFPGPVSIAQITTGNKVVTVEVRADQLSAGRKFARLAFTIAGTSPSFTMAVIPLGGEAHYHPASPNDGNQVTQRLVA